jgi:CRISPR/Cas system-associated protein Csm6
MKKILISNTYDFTPMVGAITKIDPAIVYAIIDNKPDSHQKEAVKKLKNTFKHITFKEIKTEVYKVYDVAKEIVKIIDEIYILDSEIYIDITSGRKTKSIGLLLAGYQRADKIKDILYFTHEINQMITLPKLSFEISKKASDLLEIISKKPISLPNLANTKKLNSIGRTSVYLNIRDLKEKNMVFEKDGLLYLTDYGKLVLL